MSVFFFSVSTFVLLHRSSLFGNFYNKMSHMMPSSKDQSKRSITKQMSPALAAQLEGLWKESTSDNNRFHEPEMQQITKVGDSSRWFKQMQMYFVVAGEHPAVQEGRSAFWLQLSTTLKPPSVTIREAPGLVHLFRMRTFFFK